MPHPKNITGETFGNLTALSVVGKYQRQSIWRCACSCGNLTDVRLGNLTSGNTKSCGRCVLDNVAGMGVEYEVVSDIILDILQVGEFEGEIDARWTRHIVAGDCELTSENVNRLCDDGYRCEKWRVVSA